MGFVHEISQREQDGSYEGIFTKLCSPDIIPVLKWLASTHTPFRWWRKFDNNTVILPHGSNKCYAALGTCRDVKNEGSEALRKSAFIFAPSLKFSKRGRVAIIGQHIETIAMIRTKEGILYHHPEAVMPSIHVREKYSESYDAYGDEYRAAPRYQVLVQHGIKTQVYSEFSTRAQAEKNIKYLTGERWSA